MKGYLLGLLLFAPGLAAAQATYPFVVKGKIGSLNAPAKIYLLKGEVLDSATLKNGQFELKGAVQWLGSAELILERQGKLRENYYQQHFFRPRDRLPVFLEPGPIVVTSPDSLPHARITGGPLTADYQRMNAVLTPFSDRFKTAKSQAESKIINQEYAQVAMTFIKANPNSWVSLELLEQIKMLAPPQYTEVAPLYEAFSPTLKNSPPGRFYGDMLRSLKAAAVGAEAPNFTQATPKGKAVSLRDYRGKYVLLHFWASWCSTCRQENPTIIKTYTAYKNRNFDILSVSLDREEMRDLWVQAIADDHLPWAQVSDLRGLLNEAAMLYGVDNTSKNFLIDPAGKIVATNLHGDELEATLAKLLK